MAILKPGQQLAQTDKPILFLCAAEKEKGFALNKN